MSSVRNAGSRSGTVGYSASVMGDLDIDIGQLGAVSEVIAEFRSLSVSLNQRMDTIEGLNTDINCLPDKDDQEEGIKHSGLKAPGTGEDRNATQDQQTLVVRLVHKLYTQD